MLQVADDNLMTIIYEAVLPMEQLQDGQPVQM
jgi:hypothetical protein